jgi:hypothetical protein
VEVVQAALAQRKSQIETHGPSPFKRQSLRQQGRTELDEGMLAWALALVIKSKQDNPL